MSNDPLSSFELSLSRLYGPLCGSRESWGDASQEQCETFCEELDKMAGDMQDSIKSFHGGLELRKPDRRYDEKSRSSQKDTEMVLHFETLLEEWCDKIELFLETSMKDYSATTVDSNSGPMTELDYWRRRMQRLTSITEQLKTKECKTVIGWLSSFTKNPQDNNRQHVFSLLRRWKQIDINITEAANEAKDNVKYLFTLEKFIEPLYSGTPAFVIDALPALMNSIKMIHTIARYYNTNERMTTLFSKITNQMIVNCKKCIEGAGEDLWCQNLRHLWRTSSRV